MDQETRNCQNCKQDFTIESEDFDFYKKISVPPPTFCSECRLVRRLAWRNMRSLYKRKCDLCGVEKIGVYSPDKPFRVYCSSCWWGDGWDGSTYGREYDESRNFFEQFRELLGEAPLLSRFVYEDTLLRSEYTNMAGNLKDCYLVFNCGTKESGLERCAYCTHTNGATDCLDLLNCSRCELCYFSYDLANCYRVRFSRSSNSCQDSWFLKDCTNCHDCFGCVNLRSRSYCIWNTQYSKEAYAEKLKEMGFISGSFSSILKFQEQAKDFWLKSPVKNYQGLQNSNVSGDGIYNSKNAKRSFHCIDLENCKYCYFLVSKVKDSYDWVQYGDGGELIYDTVQAGEGIYNDKFGWCIWRQSKNCEYGVLNVNCSDCFGCVGLRNKKFCVLNKQYTEEEYRALRKKIIAGMNAAPYRDSVGRTYEYGEFYPFELSPFGYNETTAQEEFPIDEVVARSKGYKWEDVSKFRGMYKITRPADDLPDDISAATEKILEEVIGCAGCERPFRLIPMEFAFYRAQNLPLPRLCPECRFMARHRMQNPLRLWPRQCVCDGSGNGGHKNSSPHFHGDGPCPNKFETSYAPDRPEIVYCEQCYNSEVA